MIAEVIRKDLLLSRRELTIVVLGVICLVFLLLSLLVSQQRKADFAAERSAALEVDRAVWLDQGERNPHSAAHFSRYAFRSSPALAAVDPGISDFAGVAVWLEAHFQDPAEFRRAEDSGSLSRFVQLSPASLFLVALPLLIFIALHGFIAGEREDGTFRQLIASGLGGTKLFCAKVFGGVRLILPLSLTAFLLAVVVALMTTEAELTTDVVVRAVGLLLLYLIFLVTLVAIAVGVSALFRNRQSALLALVCVWAVTAVLVPRLAADAGRGVFPQPDAREVTRQLRAASDIYYADKDRQEQIRRDVLAEYGVAEVEDLPIDYGAYVLQVSEELSEPEFERLYRSIADRHRQQNAVIRFFSLASPQIPAAALSRALAGTDSIHQERFVEAAELHRREMIKMLNEDYMFNAGSQGYAYAADEALWQKFLDFEHRQPQLAQLWGEYFADVVLLLLWLAGALYFAQRLVVRAYRAEGE